MSSPRDDRIAELISSTASPMIGGPSDYDPLLELIGNSHLVLLGEASHGTHEFYCHRAQITKRLITEKGFTAVAVEADWPDAYRVNTFVRGEGDDPDATEALAGFQRFPAWMWRNADVLDFAGWLRSYNEHHVNKQAGLYGLDLYSLHTSIQAVLDYLDKVDPEAARRARYRYGCFEQFGEDTQAYGYAASFGLSKTCEDEALQQWLEMRRRAADLSHRDGRVMRDAFFFAEQNARLVKNAEEYYRSMFRGRISSWNLRDTHMADTLHALVQHLGRNQAGIPSFVLRLKYNGELRSALHKPRLERAIGVIYRPQSERASHYFHARLPEQFDAILHIDETRAVEPLERAGEWEAGEVPETFPSAL